MKTTGREGERGYDRATKSKGRKRHVLVDIQGFLFKVKVYLADVMERQIFGY